MDLSFILRIRRLFYGFVAYFRDLTVRPRMHDPIQKHIRIIERHLFLFNKITFCVTFWMINSLLHYSLLGFLLF